MGFYKLQARRKDGSLISFDSLNFSNVSNELIAIDQFTNPHDYWSFLDLVKSELKEERTDLIDSFQITIKGKDYAYSVCFKNQFLAPILEIICPNFSNHQIPSDLEALLEMKQFLFQDLNQKESTFLKCYPYRNQLLNKAHKYVNTLSDSEEDLYEKKFLESEITKEIRNYKTYRSLCIYRKNLNKRNRLWIPSSKSKLLIETFSHSLTNTAFPEIDNYSYQANWKNNEGEEREEFLEPEEIEQMGVYYGKKR